MVSFEICLRVLRTAFRREHNKEMMFAMRLVTIMIYASDKAILLQRRNAQCWNMVTHGIGSQSDSEPELSD